MAGSIDPLVFWTALGVFVVVIGQLGQFMHLTSKMERRFTVLEVQNTYIQKSIDSLERRHVDRQRGQEKADD